MKKITTVAVLAMMSLSPAVLAESTIAQLEERLSNLELKNDLNLLQFAGRFITRYDNITVDKRDGGYFNHNLYRLQFSLDMSANLNSKLNFHGRLTSSKYFNHMNRGSSTDPFGAAADVVNADPTRDFGVADNFSGGPTTFLERAFLNYNVTDNMVFTVGRLPTIDGAPAEYLDDVSRQGTYPLMAFSYVLDGAAVTYNFQNLPGGRSLSARFIYTPFVNYDSLTNNMKTGGSSSKKTLGASGTSGTAQNIEVQSTVMREVENTTVVTGMLDYSSSAGLVGKEFGAIAQYSHAEDLFYPASILSNINFDYSIATLHTHINGVANSNLDLSLDATFTNVKSNGFANKGKLLLNGADISTTNLGNGAPAATGCIDLDVLGAGNPTGARGGTCKGFLTNQESDSSAGIGLLMSAKYKFNSVMLKNPSLGVEGIKGSKNYFKFDGASHELSGFYSTRGWGAHVYWLQPVTDGLKLRIGYINKVNEFGSGTFAVLGDAVTNKDRIQNVYANLRLDF